MAASVRINAGWLTRRRSWASVEVCSTVLPARLIWRRT
jgi:hypothetical protein